jgi:FixJ family two-component response regulator
MRIPAIILTADRDVAQTAASKDGDIVFLQKPANAQRIRRIVMELIPPVVDAMQHQAVSSE